MKINVIKLFFVVIVCLFSINIFAIEQNPYPFTSSADETRFMLLINEIRCVVCQNQSIADSAAPIAADIRTKVYRMVLDNQSNADIKNYLTDRYGEFILLRPRFNKLTFLLWMFPLFGLMIGGYLLFRFKR
jgi:cytochrome c-type biogenesis protein CcmH